MVLLIDLLLCWLAVVQRQVLVSKRVKAADADGTAGTASSSR